MNPFTVGASWAFTLSGTATSEGDLSLSTDGRYVVAAGYGANIGTASVNSTDANTYPRVVARLDALGNVDTTTSLGTAFSLNSVRGVASTDGNSIWVSGNGSTATGGVHYAMFGGSTTTQILSAPNNVRFVRIFNDQLYGTSGSGSYVNVFAIGSGLPMTAGQTAMSLPGLPVLNASPYSFAFFDRLVGVPGIDTLYIADDRTLANGGGIQRWVSDGFTWTLEATFGDGLAGVRGLTAKIEGQGVRIIATTAETPTNRILSIYDEPGVNTSIVPIATAQTNSVYRGVAFAPQ